MDVRTTLNQLDQSVRIMVDAGDGLRLWFDDRRVGTRRDDRDVAIRLTGADTVHDLVAVRVKGRLGGIDLDEVLEPEPNQFFRATWDGTGAKDGRPYTSDLEIGWDLAARFPRPDRTRWWTRRVVCGSVDLRSIGCGGFVPEQLHRLDVDTNQLWRGDGSHLAEAVTRRAAVLANVTVSGDEHAVPDGELVHVFDHRGWFQGSLQARKGRVIATAEHDDAGRITRFSTHGHEFALEHRSAEDGLRSEVVIEGPAEVWVGIERDEHGRAITLVDHDRHMLSLEYDDLGCLATVRAPSGLVTEIERDELGRVVAMRDSTGRHQRIERHEHRDLTVTTGAGRSTRLRHVLEPNGTTIATVTNGTGHASLEETGEDSHALLQANGTLTTTTSSVRSSVSGPLAVDQALIESPSGRKLQLTRESAHDSERLTIDGRVWIQRFDPSTRTLKAIDPGGLETVTVHQPGSSLVVTPPGRRPLEIRFDAMRRPKLIRQGDSERRIGYDQYGRLAWTEQERVRLHVHHDERGRITGVMSPEGWHRFARDASGRLLEIENACGAITRFDRRVDGLLERIVRPSIEGDVGQAIFGYDPDGLMVLERFGQGDDWTEPIDYGRDAAGRVVSITCGGEKVLARHDDESGELVEMSAANGETLTWAWDGDMCWSVDVAGATPARIERIYDDSHTIAMRSVNRTSVVNYVRGDDNQLTNVGPVTIERNLSARDVVGLRLGSLTTNVRRDDDGRVAAQETRLGRLAAIFFAERIERDEFGRVTEVAEHVQGIDRHLTYTYDDSGRLASATVNGDEILKLRYDANHNLTRITRQGRALDLVYRSDDRLAAVAGAPVTHDPAGRLLRIGDHASLRDCDRDGLGQLIAARDGAGNAISYRLDPLGRPVEVTRTSSGEPGDPIDPEPWGRHRFVWDDDRLAATLDADDQVDARFVDSREADGAPEAIIRDGYEYLLIRDHVGSVRAVVEATSGTVVQAMCFDPLGRTLLDTAPGWQPFGFAGGIMDPVGGLVRFGARVYDPFIGRYLSPVGHRFSGSLNHYLFRGGDPVNDARPTTQNAHRAGPNSRSSSPLGELRIATDPFLFERPITPDRWWLDTGAFAESFAIPTSHDALLELRRSWRTERTAARPTFDAVWDPLDACSGKGGFDYQPSPEAPVRERLAHARDLVRNPPSIADVAGRLHGDLSRVIDGLPD